jgi:hypothetical protein
MTGVLDIEYPYVIGGGYNDTISTIWHKFDGEYVGAVAGEDRSRKAELGRRCVVIRVKVDSVVVRSARKKSARRRPAVGT